MKNMKRCLFFLLVSLLSVCSYAQQDTEFWFAAPYINCEHGSISPYRLVVFAFDKAATVTISMPATPDFEPIVERVAANSYANIELAQDKTDGDTTITTPFNEITQRGLLITSTSRIECYYQIDGDNSEAFTLKGRNALGTDFLVTGQKSYNNGSTGEWYGARNSIHIVATEDNTLVRIVPSCAILDMVGTVGDTIDVVLQKGETYAVASADNIATSNLIGSRILSSAPIAVTMNDDSVTPNDSNADDIGEQLLSTEFAGMNFVVVAEGSEYELCTVFALEDNTQIITSNGDTIVINKNEYQEISLFGVQVMSIHTTQPVMIFQVVTIDGAGELGGTVVPHVECTGSTTAGYMPFSSSYDVYINLITRKSNIANFTINGAVVASSLFSPVDLDDEFYYARIKKPAASTPYIVHCTSGVFQMGVMEGGPDGSATYGFFSDYEQQIPMGILVNGNPICSAYCVLESEKLSLEAYALAGFNIDNITWTLPNKTVLYGEKVDLDEVTPDLIGTYYVSATTEECGEVIFSFLVRYPPLPTDITDVFCEGDAYVWEGHYMADGVTPLMFSAPGVYCDTVPTLDGGCDSVVYLHLEMLPTTYYTQDTTIIKGEVYVWNGVEYTTSFVDVDTLVNMYGCDSIVTVSLNVLENEAVIHRLEPIDQCADEKIVELLMEWEGRIDSIELQFVRDTIDSVFIGLHDTIVPLPADGYVSISYNKGNVRAGVHDAIVRGYFSQSIVFEERVSITYLYPSSVLEQRWDDVICVLTSGYNGGYDFTAFQWYKNGLPLDGEIGYYLSQPLEDGAEYSALLTEVDGTQLMTCPLVVDIKAPEVSVEPTLVTKRQPVRCQVTEKANLYVYDAMGKVQISSTLLEGETFVHLPQQAGIYMLKVVMHTGVEKCFKVLVM